mgnify:FL=1
MAPTKIYVSSVLPLMKTGDIKAFAHITGGGLLENIPRILPDGFRVKLDASTWEMPAVFGWMSEKVGMTFLANLGTWVVLLVFLDVLHVYHPQLVC